MTGAILLAAALLAAATAVWGVCVVRRRHAAIWLPAWIRKDWAGRRTPLPAPSDGPLHILFCVADHFEPEHGHPGAAVERERVRAWVSEYPRLFERFRDSDGFMPRHTFFYPAEAYRAEHLDLLSRLVARGCGEVEVHLHHDRDTAENLRNTLRTFTLRLRSHGLLGADSDGAIRFGFVHGNWALDNPFPDGRWCGVANELQVLAEAGCYADFTLPSAPSPTQTRRINSIYYATGDPDRVKSHDDGIEARVGQPPAGTLLLIQGPLGLRWPGRRCGGLLPVLENGNLSGAMPPTPARVAFWASARIGVAGRPDWIFVKVHTHGCQDRNRATLLGAPALALHEHLARRYNDGARYRLHYVTAREMYNIAKAAEQGLQGDPNAYRNRGVEQPPCARAAAPSSAERCL